MMFKDMNGRNGVIYRGMWDEYSFPQKMPIVKNGATYKIAGRSGEECQAIIEAYEIENETLFRNKFAKAVSGNGDEVKKILTLHSSSRCALLCFYNVDQEHLLKINLDGKEVSFDYSTFEFKNPVIGYPSNMDVVLVSTKQKVVLFLESKFSEYYMSAGIKSSHISSSYEKNKFSGPFYQEEFLKALGITKMEDELPVKDDAGNVVRTKKGFILSAEQGKPVYLDGFKQMISHYVGIRRRINKDVIKADHEKDNKEIVKIVLGTLNHPDSKIYLAEVLYDEFSLPKGLESELDPQTALKNYSELYTELSSKMNEVIKESELSNRFKVLSFELKYSEIMQLNPHIESTVREFYGIKE